MSEDSINLPKSQMLVCMTEYLLLKVLLMFEVYVFVSSAFSSSFNSPKAG